MTSFSDLLTITMNPVQVILTLIVGLLMGLYVWFIYKKTFSGVMYSRTYGMTTDDIMSKKQNAPITKVRQICMYIVREITDMSLEEIGKNFGKNHATVLHSINKISSLMEAQPKEKNVIEDIIKNLQSNNSL